METSTIILAVIVLLNFGLTVVHILTRASQMGELFGLIETLYNIHRKELRDEQERLTMLAYQKERHANK